MKSLYNLEASDKIEYLLNPENNGPPIAELFGLMTGGGGGQGDCMKQNLKWVVVVDTPKARI